VDPDGRSDFQANAKAFQDKLKGLAKWTRLQLAGLPKSQRILVTSHDALGYFARDYGFQVLPVQGISTSDQPSSQKVRNLIKEIKSLGVKAIFAENIENPKVLQQITVETGANLGGMLYADGLGIGDAGTYIGMMRSNVTTIVGALQ
jgi:zinc/manganese transport system substrate-binding protein